MVSALHPTEIYKKREILPLEAEVYLLPIPTCRRPPLGLSSSSVTLSPTSTTHRLTPIHTDPSRMDTDEDGVTDYIELQGWDVIVIHERRGEVMEDRCEYGVWSLPVRFDSEGDGASDETEWKFHGNPDSSDSDKDGIPDSEESGPNLTMVEGTPPVILDKKGRDKSSEKYSGAYIKTKVKVKTKWSISGVKIKGKIIVIFTVVDNAGLDKAVIYVQTGGERIIYLGGDKRREIEEVFDIGDLLRLIHGGYDIRVNVTDINGNWIAGKTHIDSALETLKKGLMALLEIFKAVARVIAKVASMLIDVIKKIVSNMLRPVLETIKKGIKAFILKIGNALQENQYLLDMFSKISLDNTRLEIHGERVIKTIELIIIIISGFLLSIEILFRVIEAIEISTKAFTAAISGLVSILIKYSKPMIYSVIFAGVVSSIEQSKKEIDSSIRMWMRGSGESEDSLLTTILSWTSMGGGIVSTVKDLYEAFKAFKKEGFKSKLGKKLFGLGLAIAGAVITVFSFLYPNANGAILLTLDVFGLVLSTIGLLTFLHGSGKGGEKVVSGLARFTSMLEEIIAFASPFAAVFAIIAHWSGGEYDEG